MTKLRPFYGIIALTLVAGAVPLVLDSPRWLNVLSIALYYVILATSWNLMMGYTGLFSFAHTALAAIGGYTSGLLAVKAGVPPVLSMPISGISAAIASLVLGVVSLRLRGFYLCLVTWAFAEISVGVFRVEYKVTGGSMGLLVPPLFPTAAGKVPYYYLGLGLVVAALVFMVLLSRSRAGIYLRSIRDDELASEVLGVNTIGWKVFCFTVCGFWAGLAGGYYGHLIGVVDPGMGALSEMGLVILMVIIGGMGTLTGPVAGAFLIVVLSEALRGKLEAMSLLFFAVIMVLVMRFLPGGLMAGLRGLASWTRSALRRRPRAGELRGPGPA